METYYNPEDLAKFGTIGEKASELAEKFFAYYNAVFEEGALTAREKSLIALAVAHTVQCPYCIDAYTNDCLDKGVSEEQMTEAVHVAAAIRGGASLVHGVQMKKMKKKIVTLLLVAAMTGTMVVGCGSKADDKTADTKTEQTDDKKDTEEKKELADDEYQYVSAADTVIADGVHVLDVREWENYSKGRVANSEWCPIFPLEDDSLVDEMTTYAKDHLNDGKDIYVICNSGKRGAEKATAVLRDAGIEPTSIYTVEGGAEALGKENGALTTDRTEENIDWKYVSGKDAVDKVGDKDVQFLDVRDDDTYKAGHLKGTLQCSLKEFDTPEAQTEMYNLAKDKMDKDEPVYILCYSGNKCAKTAISVMKDAGFDTDNLFIIENGAKDGDVSAAFVTE